MNGDRNLAIDNPAAFSATGCPAQTLHMTSTDVAPDGVGSQRRSRLAQRQHLDSERRSPFAAASREDEKITPSGCASGRRVSRFSKERSRLLSLVSFDWSLCVEHLARGCAGAGCNQAGRNTPAGATDAPRNDGPHPSRCGPSPCPRHCWPATLRGGSGAGHESSRELISICSPDGAGNMRVYPTRGKRIGGFSLR